MLITQVKKALTNKILSRKFLKNALFLYLNIVFGIGSIKGVRIFYK